MTRSAELAEHANALGLDRHLYGNAGLEEYAGWLQRAQSGNGLVVDRAMKRRMEDCGFFFEDERDNRSVYQPEDVFPRFQRFVEDRQWNPDMQKLTNAFNRVWKMYAKPKEEEFLELPTREEIDEKLHLTHSSGLPHMKRKGEVLDEDWELAIDILEKDVTPPSCISFVRVGVGEDGPRPRLIWGYPGSMTILEGILAIPLNQRFLSEGGSGSIAFGISRGMLAGKLCHLESFNTRVSIDFSGFDASINVWLIHRAFDILKTYFAPSQTLKRLWRKIIKYFIYTKIVLPDGRRYGKKRGVPSGSWFTQLVDDLVTLIAINYAFARNTGRMLDDDQVMVLGDDCVLGCNDNLTLQNLGSSLMELGLDLNVEKSRLSRYGQACHFLGHDWFRGFMTRPLNELVQRLIYPGTRNRKK